MYGFLRLRVHDRSCTCYLSRFASTGRLRTYYFVHIMHSYAPTAGLEPASCGFGDHPLYIKLSRLTETSIPHIFVVCKAGFVLFYRHTSNPLVY